MLTGNDIVDLHSASIESNWRRPNYLQKVFTEHEQQMIHQAPQPDVMVWLLWSMKEAAYKVYSRKYNVRSYAPTQLQCQLRPSTNRSITTGMVQIEGLTLHTQSRITANMVHSIAAEDAFILPEIQVRISLRHHPANQNYRRHQPDSVSHHGMYLALIFARPGSPQSGV